MTEVKIPKMRGMRTVEEDRKIPEDQCVELQNMIVKDGEDVGRYGFTKVNATKLSNGINGLYDYRNKRGRHISIIIEDGNIQDIGNGYTVEAPATVYAGVNFTITVTKLDVWGARDYTYNGTCNFTENSDASLGTSSLALTQGRGVLTTQQLTGGTSETTVTITGTDSVDSQITGTDNVYYTSGFSLIYNLSGADTRGYHFWKTGTKSTGATAISSVTGDSRLWFCNAFHNTDEANWQYGGLEGWEEWDVNIISVDTSNVARMYVHTAIDLQGGFCLADWGSKLYMGCAGWGDVWVTADGATWSVSAGTELGLVVYTLFEFDSVYYAGTGYDGKIYKTSDLTQAWTEEYDSTSLSIMNMMEFGSKLYAVGSSGSSTIGGPYAIYRQDSPGSWTEVETGALTQYFCAEVCNGYMFVGEHDDTAGTNDRIIRTSNGTDYTEKLALGDYVPICMLVDGTRLYVGCTNGKIYYTDDDGDTWTNMTSPSAADIHGIAKYNSLIWCCSYSYIYAVTPPT